MIKKLWLTQVHQSQSVSVVQDLHLCNLFVFFFCQQPSTVNSKKSTEVGCRVLILVGLQLRTLTLTLKNLYSNSDSTTC